MGEGHQITHHPTQQKNEGLIRVLITKGTHFFHQTLMPHVNKLMARLRSAIPKGKKGHETKTEVAKSGEPIL